MAFEYQMIISAEQIRKGNLPQQTDKLYSIKYPGIQQNSNINFPFRLTMPWNWDDLLYSAIRIT